MTWHNLDNEIAEVFSDVRLDWSDVSSLRVFNPEETSKMVAQWAKDHPLRKKAHVAKARAKRRVLGLDSKHKTPRHKLSRDEINARRRASYAAKKTYDATAREAINARRRAAYAAKKATKQ